MTALRSQRLHFLEISKLGAEAAAAGDVSKSACVAMALRQISVGLS
jgi:hypothetical protein